MKVRSAVRNSTSPRRGSSVLAAVWLMGCLAVSGFFGWHFLSNDNSTPAVGTVVAATANTASESPYVTKSIRDIRIGERVLAHNPEVTDLERRQAVIPDSSWRHIHLEMTKADDSVLKIELLRPRDWVVSHHAYAGTTIHLDLEEMGASGPARVVNIGRAPPLAKGSDQIVTGTFSHSAGNVINLYVDGLDEPIGTTDNHPFWSEDRQAFIPAGKLQSGERLRTEDGNLLAVTSSSPRVADAVFNLEVNAEHVYFVSTKSVLVHNSYGTALHYTDEAGFDSIMKQRVIRQNDGNVYFTTDEVPASEAVGTLFAGDARFAGKGDYVIGFNARPGLLFEGETQMNELFHPGSLADGVDIIFAGPNPF